MDIFNCLKKKMFVTLLPKKLIKLKNKIDVGVFNSMIVIKLVYIYYVRRYHNV